MSNIFNDPLWPNGIQTDDEGYAVFYPLGTNKIPVPTAASDWPEGSKLIFPFVYDENDKLVDFCDTKAMEIDNNNTIIDMPYTDIKADFSSIIEGTLTINTPSDSNVEIKWGSVDKVLTEKIEKVLGKGNCKVKFDKDTNKATVVILLDTAESQLAEIESLLERVLPNNFVTELEYYKPMEWLYSSGKPYIDTGIIHTADIGMIYEVERTFIFDSYLGGTFTVDGKKEAAPARYVPGMSYNPHYPGTSFSWGRIPDDLPLAKTVSSLNFLNNKKLELKNEYVNKESELSPMSEGLTWKSWALFTRHNPPSVWSGRGRIYWAKFSQDNEIIAHFVPALDWTGAPCMFDIVTKTPFYNSGSSDFTYPEQEQAIQTLALDWDAKSYAKFTEHGIRRLYHVPKGYTGSIDDYAAENGFKELIEPPMPEEGYWVPEWCETETQLICDWVETEPPVEEEIQ